MANKLLITMLGCLDRGLRTKKITTMAHAWDACGRSDLREIDDARKLVGAPVLSSFYYEAKKRLAERLIEVEADDGNGGKIKVLRRAVAGAKRPTPLTSFIVPAFSPGGYACFAYHHLRPTKGWRRELIDEGEARMYRKQGVPALIRFEGNRAIVRKAA